MKSLSKADIEYLLKNHYDETMKKADQLLEILEPLIRIYSPTGKEMEISEHVVEFVKSLDSNFVVETDDLGNVFVLPKEKKSSVLLNAHLDVVDETIYDRDKISNVSLKNKNFKENGVLKPNEYDDFILGFDDKIGVAIILWLLKYRKDLAFKALFTVREESKRDTEEHLIKKYQISDRSGGVGIEYALVNSEDFFYDLSSCLLIDRAENKSKGQEDCIIRDPPSDLVNYYSLCDSVCDSLCSSGFLQSFKQMTRDLKTPMVEENGGFAADAVNIKLRHPNIDILNLAAGGYREHHADDFLNVFEAVRTLRVVEKFLR